MAATKIVLKADLLHAYCMLIVLPENPPKTSLIYNSYGIKYIAPDVKFPYIHFCMMRYSR